MKALWNKLFVPTLVITMGFVAGDLHAAAARGAAATPAMAAGLTDHRWTVEELLAAN